MAFTLPVIPKQNTVAATPPTTSALAIGEIALNVRDGILYTNYTPDGTTQTILQLGGVGFLKSGAAIDGSIIGGTTPAAGSFTTLNVSSTITFSGLTASTVLGLDASKHPVSLTMGAGLTLSSGTLSVTPTSLIASPSAKTAAYTVTQADNNTVIVVNSASAVAITLPSLTAGSTVTVFQRGAGKVTWTASGTTVTVYPSGSTGTAGAGASWTAFWDTSTTILIGGAVV
jgi:hypothetical protein